MRALVTGVAGFIGSHLAEQLLDRGATVTGLDCFTDYYPRAIKEANLAALRGRQGFRFIESPIQEADLPALVRECTHVFHLAAQPGVRRSWGREFQLYTTHNIEATQLLLEACVDVPLERFVYASSSSVYGDEVPLPMREEARVQPVSPYGVTKLAAELLCRLYYLSYGVPTVALRYFTVYGPRQRPDMAFYRFCRAALMGRPIVVYGDGTQTRDFTYVTDAVAATVAAGDRGLPGRVYNIGGGARVSVNDVLALVARRAGRPLQIRHEPAQKGDMRDTYADTTLARDELGFRPAVSLEAGLDRELEWLAAVSTVTE